MAERTRLLLIRHGESEANLRNVFAGHWDPALTELGLKQAAATGAFLKEWACPELVYASDLKRAATTGEYVAKAAGAELRLTKQLREIDAGAWEGVAFRELEARQDPVWESWRKDIGHCRCPGGEAVTELTQRVAAELRRIAEENPGKTVAIATHATPVRAMMWYISGQPLSHMKDIPWVSNASVTEIFVESGEFSLGQTSLDDHLQDMKTALPPNV